MHVVATTHLKTIYTPIDSVIKRPEFRLPPVVRNDLSKYAVLRLDLYEAPNIVQQAYNKLSVNAVRM